VLGSGELQAIRGQLDTAVYSTGSREVSLRTVAFSGAQALADAILDARRAA